ncbi:ABC transporter substrate-binding protein [Oscillospiraceae bacterium MB08-C2-2]|nr:ABC transporter substrate-binding protein [Oscillospiraceae bacterium MB08-C2-2]
MKKSVRFLAALLMVAMLVAGCSTTPPSETPASSAPASTNAASSTPAAAGSDNVAVPGDEKVYIGLVAAQTGTNKATGEMAINGATLAVEQVNAAGGILGKQIELVIADEIDNLDASVNASARLLSDPRISVIIGSQYSQNILATMPQILEKKISFIALGSNDAIAAEGNPYVWQPRNHDAGNARILSTYAHDTLGIKNPAVLCSTLPNAQGPGQAVRDYYKSQYNLPITDDRYFEYNEEEKNFAPIIAQIANSGADGLLSFGNQQPHALISKAIADNGLDIPRLANAPITSSIVIDNAGKAANGWFSTTDWAYTLDTEVGAAFEKAYFEKYGKHTEGSMAYTYDSVYLVKKAMETANDCYDREAINTGFGNIKDMEGVLGTYNAQRDHGFLSEVFLVQIEDGKIMLKDKVKYR